MLRYSHNSHQKWYIVSQKYVGCKSVYTVLAKIPKSLPKLTTEKSQYINNDTYTDAWDIVKF